MGRDVRITIIGAGSAVFAAGIVRDLCLTAGLHGSHVALMDVDAYRLDMIHRMATRLSDELEAGLSFSKTTNRQEALEGADFVLNTALVGGHDWMEEQRSLGEKHGYYRGTRLYAAGQLLFFIDVARDIERICPDAWLLQSANPVFEGCTAMHRETGVKAIGLCHGHYGYLQVARTLGLDPDDVSARMPGFNHWIWMTEFRHKGEDAYPLLDEWVRTKAEEYWANDDRGYGANQMRRAAIHQYRLFGLMPIGDTPRVAGWWYHTDLEAKQRWFGPMGGFDSEIGWDMYLRNIAQRTKTVEQSALDEGKPITETFKPVRSREQIVPIIDSIVHDRPAHYQVNIPNRGPIIQGFPEDLVIECEGTVDGAGARGITVPPLPRKLTVAAMVPRWHQAELMLEAVRTGDRGMLLHCLLADPRTRSLDQAEQFLAEWLAHPQNKTVAGHFGAG